MSQVCAYATRDSTLLLAAEHVVLNDPEDKEDGCNGEDEIE